MNVFRFVASTLLFVAVHASAQAGDRLDLERRIDTAYLRNGVLTKDSPAIGLLLASAKSANPGAGSDVWESIKPEFADAATAVFLSKDGALAGALHTALAQLSDAEMERLTTIIEDPVYGRFQSILMSPEVQRELLGAFAKNSLVLGAVLNASLAKHGLKEVH